jgi:hypothetical protein
METKNAPNKTKLTKGYNLIDICRHVTILVTYVKTCIGMQPIQYPLALRSLGLLLLKSIFFMWKANHS